MTEFVKAYDRNGRKVLVPKEEVDSLVALGGRVATAKEIAESELQEDYASKSPGQKLLGALSVASPIGALLRETGVIDAPLPPQLEAYSAGLKSSVGLQGLQRQAIDATQGEEAGTAFADRQEQLAAAFPTTTTAAKFAGTTAALATGEGLALRGLGAAASRAVLPAAEGLGALGRAAVTGARFGARGAIEGGLMGAAEATNESLLKDEDIEQYGDRLLLTVPPGLAYGALGGVALGAGGSLAKSGVQAAGRGLVRMGARAATSALDFATGASARAATSAGDVAAANSAIQAASEDAVAGASGLFGRARDVAREYVAENVGSVAQTLKDPALQKDFARRRAFDQVSRGYGLQPTKYIDALRKKGITAEEAGEWLFKRKVINPAADIVEELKAMEPEKMLERVRTALNEDATKLGATIDATPARMTGREVMGAFDAVAKTFMNETGRAPQVGALPALREIESVRQEMIQALGLMRGKNLALDKEVRLSRVLSQRRRITSAAWKGKLDAPEPTQALRDVGSELERRIETALDMASSKAIGEERAAYKAIKRDYEIGKTLSVMIDDSANRQAKAATFGLRDTIQSGALASAGATIGATLLGPVGGFAGGMIGQVAGAVGSKFVRERGSAAAALALYRLSETGQLSSLVSKAEASIRAASKGAFVERTAATTASGTRAASRAVPGVTAASGSAKTTTPREPSKSAKEARQRIAELRSDPAALADRVSEMTRGLEPRLAAQVSASMMRAFSFAASKLPPQRKPDPLLPRTTPISQTDAEKFLRYYDAASNPKAVLDDMARGKFTREHIEALRVVVPTVYRDIQLLTIDELTRRMAKGTPIPFDTRIRLGLLLNIPADPTLKPNVRDFLQRNTEQAVAMTEQTQQGPAPQRGKSIQLDNPTPELDALEQSGPGS